MDEDKAINYTIFFYSIRGIILLRRCSNNLKQYARKANETGSVYAAEIANLQNRLDEIWELTRQSLAWLAAIR